MFISNLVRALCLAVLVFSTTATATPEDPMLHFAHWAGADKGLDFSIERPDGEDVNGGFTPPGAYCNFFQCMIVERPALIVIAGKDVPDNVVRFVIAHELGHYEQWKLGYLKDMTYADLPGIE